MSLSIESSRPRRWSAALGTALAILAGLLVALAEQQRFVPEPTAAAPAPMASPDFEQRLFAALSRPGFLERAMQAATLGREREKSRSWRELLASEPAVLDARGPFTIALGPAGATRSALVFFDYNCPHCRRLDHELARLRAAQPDIRIVALPVAMLRPSSGTAAQTVLAAARLGKGATLHEAVLAQEGEANDAVLRDAAQGAGLDWDELLKLRDSDDVKREMARIASLAQRLGVQGTPASYLSSGEVIGGAAASDRFLAAWAQK